jgi:CMP-N-acetylneuraminic acid synthetase
VLAKTPTVTVYITNYNYGRFLAQAIESVLSQTYVDFEIIIIDDGSTDGSQEIIESYADLPNVTVVYQQNKGLNASNNVALRTSRGKYIMRLDADDWLDPNALLVMVNRLETDPELGLVFPDYYVVGPDGNVVNIEKRNSMSLDVELPDLPAHGACTMIRKHMLHRVEGYDEQFSCQDGYDLWLKFVRRHKIDNVSTPLFYYRQHGNNLTGNEQRILDTRAAIKAKHLVSRGEQPGPTVGIIPIRGPRFDHKCVALVDLDGETVLDRKVEQALCAASLAMVVVTTPDDEIAERLITKYRSVPNFSLRRRDPKLARLNSGLVGTIDDVLQSLPSSFSPENFVIVTADFPFCGAREIDDIVNSLSLFRTDSAVSVRPDSSRLFCHRGKGMEMIQEQNRFTALEMDALFRYAGGLMAVRIDSYQEQRKVLCGVVGHSFVSQKAALGLTSELDLFLVEKILAEERNRGHLS